MLDPSQWFAALHRPRRLPRRCGIATLALALILTSALAACGKSDPQLGGTASNQSGAAAQAPHASIYDASTGTTWVLCAPAGGYCSFSGTSEVLFGLSPTQDVVSGTFTNGVACNQVPFNAPSDPTVSKSCWIPSTSADAASGAAAGSGTSGTSGSSAPAADASAATSWVQCAPEGGYCSFGGTSDVLFGLSPTQNVVGGTFTNGVACTQTAFGAQPDPSVSKSCWIPVQSVSGTTGATSSGSSSGTDSGSSSDTSSASSTGTAMPALTCSAPTVTAAQAADGPIRADTPSSDGTRLFPAGAAFAIALTSNAPAADTVVWAVHDHLGNTDASGSFAVPAGVQTNTLSCSSGIAGYFAISATLAKAGGRLPQAGTRPAGIATFGVLPNLTSVLGTPAYAHQDQHRFGMQGFNHNGAMLDRLGITQTLDGRALSDMEPSGPNTWIPALSDVDSFYTNGQVMRLVRLDGIPKWASPTDVAQDGTYAPTDLAYYQRYMARVGTDTASFRAVYFPQQQNDYYQVTWEPQWADTPENFVALYAAAYKGLHSTDANAVVMGTTQPFAAGNPASTAYWLHRYAALGLPNYLDAVATHAYYDAGTSPSHPPERLATDPAGYPNALMYEMRALRSEMQAEYRPNMRLVSTEVGISYDVGTSYGPDYPTANVLFAQAAVAARTHIIVLGEGAQATYFFYGADYPGEPGYGCFFDNTHAQGAFGASDVSPKPEALAFAALTRILDGTTTLGYLNGMPSMTYGYAFQRLGGGPVVTALWTHNNAVWSANAGFSSTYGVGYNLSVDAPGTSGTVQVLDMMGNVSSVAYANGIAPLTLTEAPIYVVSRNASVMQAHVTTPVGYTGQ